VPFWYTVYSKIHGKYTDCDNEARYKISENYITQWHRKKFTTKSHTNYRSDSYHTYKQYLDLP